MGGELQEGLCGVFEVLRALLKKEGKQIDLGQFVNIGHYFLEILEMQGLSLFELHDLRYLPVDVALPHGRRWGDGEEFHFELAEALLGEVLVDPVVG
jgi:hypothetical protein